MTNKRRFAQLKEARFASIAHFKKQKLEQISNTEQPRINDNKLNTNNMGDASNTGNMGNTSVDTDEKGTWFWNQSANELESDLECDRYSDSKRNSEPEVEEKGSKTEKKAPP